MIIDYVIYFFAVCVSALIVVWVIPKLVFIAKQHQIVDVPNPRRLNKIPVPVLGGVGVFLGIAVVTTLFSYDLNNRPIIYLFCGMLLMLYVGVWDDITDMRALRKLAYQGMAVGLLIVGGIRLCSFQGMLGIYELPLFFSVCLTLFYGVGILNAINLIDGIDGLAAGYGMLVSLIFGICFFMLRDKMLALICFATLGALLPFFLVNVFGRKNKMYIGDAGSLILGILFVGMITLFIGHPGVGNLVDSPIVFMLALFGIPVFDTLFVMITRMIRGNSPFAPDKTHLHHVILGFGYTHARTTFIELILCVILVGIAIGITAWSQEIQLIIMMVSGLFVVMVPRLLLQWYKQHYGEKIQGRLLANEIRKKHSVFYKSMRRLADGTYPKIRMRKVRKKSVFLGLCIVFGCTGCVSPKKVVYLQDAQINKKVRTECEYKTVIHPDDLLSIIVSCDDSEAALPFNSPMIGLGREVSTSSQQSLLGYVVDKEGYIDFPVVGRMEVEGITRNELAEMLKEKLSVYLKNPIVTIQYLNFKITVLGEVKNPGSYKVNTERISLLDALGMAGDLQISAKRKNILIVRETGDEKQFARVDLTNAGFMNTPFFYLQQNDVVYVEPNRGRVVGGNMGTFWSYVVSSISSIVAIVALIVR